MCSHLFWIGDLNYRISLPDIDVKSRIEMGDFDYLLEHDQVLTTDSLFCFCCYVRFFALFCFRLRLSHIR